MSIPPAIAAELARARHRDFVARADRDRLTRRATHASVRSPRPHLRASLQRVLRRWHVRPAAP